MCDLSGIQDFIFQTNRLKVIVGASYLVSGSLFGYVPSLAGESPDAWKTRYLRDFANLIGMSGKAADGGGITFLCGSDQALGVGGSKRHG